MKQSTWLLIIAFAIIAVSIYASLASRTSPPSPPSPASFDGKNVTFMVNGKPVTLVNGVSDVPIPNSSAKIVTRYFGNEATGDLTGDGAADVAFLITQQTGGSGTFYYVVVAIKTTGSYRTTNAFFLGDRIAPQSTEIRSGQLLVNYATRKPGEPMTAQPSQGVTKTLKVSSVGVLESL